MVNELWRPVPDYPGYEASSEGRVRSVDREVITKTGVRIYNGKLLRTSMSKGYVFVPLGRGNEHIGVHVAVCGAFHGAKPFPEAMANHKDHVRDNNTPDNLEWSTPIENAMHCVLNDRHSTAKFTKEDVLVIRERLANKEADLHIARDYGVETHIISRLRRGKTYQWV